PSGASTYTLNPGSLTGTSFTVSPSSNQTYTLTGTSAAGCVSANSATRTIVVNATPTVNIATNNLSLCTGNPLVMPIVSGGTVIQWNGPNSFTSTLAQPTVTSAISLIHAGNYSVTVAQTYGANTCTSSIAQVTVSVVSSASITVANANLCNGLTTTITPQGGNTYTLNPGGMTGLSFTLNPSTSSTYTVLGSAGSGCNGSATFSITVNNLPTVTSVASNTFICSGNSTSLTVSGADTYTWSTSASSSTNNTVTVTPSVTTSYSVVGTNTLTGCVNQSSLTINVATTPTVNFTTSSLTLCAGNSSTLSLSGADSYTITNPILTTTVSAVLTPSASTTYTIVGLTGSCLSQETTLTLNVNALPVLGSSNQTICVGNTATLSANNADAYIWSPNGEITSTIVVSPTVTTTYSVVGTSTLTGCSSILTSVSAFVNPLPTLNATVSSTAICSGATA
ncbi:MAG: hypothetical protein ACOVOV_18715, partial [Dolichospermum sp.]